MNVNREADEFLSGVRGRECWSVIGGASTGSAISIKFGDRVPLLRPLQNPTLSLEDRAFDGERSLIVYCDWRLDRGSGIVCTSQTVDDVGTLDLSALNQIKGQIVQDIEFTSRMYDLRIQFVNGYHLSVFCDLAADYDGSNYIMFNPKTCIAVTAQGNLSVEMR